VIEKYYCLSEYSYLASDKYTNEVKEPNKLLCDKVFSEIEKFVLENKFEDDSGINEFLISGYNKHSKKILKAQNYVGVLQTKSGTTIEILPKIHMDSEDESYNNTRKIFLNMLKSLKRFPFKNFNLANLKTCKINLMDIFITMFLDELNILIKRGIKSGYINMQDNSKFFKGKLLVNMQIKNNLVHKENFYVEFDSFSPNIIENRIIKSTLVYLSKKSNSNIIQRRIREYLFIFGDIDESMNHDVNFSKCINNRVMNDYSILLKWCRIFLNKESFTNFKGNNIAYALIYPMEKVFESYIAHCIKNSSLFKEYETETQESKYYLIKNPEKFRLRPDIVMRKDGQTIILDTKWKLLNQDPNKNYGISQSDLYQMYAYAKKYNSNKVVLIYPMNKYTDKLTELKFEYEKDITLYIFFTNLEDINASLEALKELIKNNGIDG